MSTQASTSSAKAAILQKHDNDVVIVCAVRSAITKVPFPRPCQHLQLTLHRAGREASKTPIRSSSFPTSCVQPTPRSAWTPSSSKTSQSATFSLQGEAPPPLAWQHCTLASPSKPPSTPSIANALPGSQPSTKSLTKSARAKSKLALASTPFLLFLFLSYILPFFLQERVSNQ